MGGMRRLFAVIGLVAIGLAGAACTTPPIFTAACRNTLVSTSVGPLTHPELQEISGIETGVQNAGMWWVHNDSGNPNRLYAVDDTATVRATLTVTGAMNVDWEDLAITPGPTSGSGVVFVGDIGDNTANRSEIQVYRFAEPVVPTSGPPVDLSPTTTDVLHFTYPDGAHDAEALTVDPLTGDLWIITKNIAGGTVGVYRAPSNASAGSTTTLEKVRDIVLPTGLTNAVTAVDASLDGKVLALRTYGAIRIYGRHPSVPLSAVFDGTPCTAPTPIELQGESISFDNTARTIVTVSEGPGQNIHRSAVP